jgi:hypothetical protein
MNSVVRSWHSRQAVTVAPGSPWQNCFSERLIGTIRRECLDRRAGEREYLGRYIRPKRDDTVLATFFWRLPKALNYIGFRDLSAGRAELAAIGGHRGHVVLGVARLRPDQHAQSRWLAHARHQAHRSTDGSCRVIEAIKKGGTQISHPSRKTHQRAS